ncbi:MAG: DNA translocase FtsK [Pirellulales bacterium]|nr:DNA translocase FtsK [Pirellulales bacterium]
MPQERSRQVDLFALALLALTIFLALALLTYDPADPPSALVHPPHTSATNACGHVGAYVAHALFSLFGLGAYYLVLSLAVADATLLARGQVTEPVLRTIGWFLSLVGLSTLAAMALEGFSPGPVIGAGGYLGATGRGVLELHVATVGAYILMTSVTLGGLLLCTDYVLLRISGWVLGKPAQQVGRGLAKVGRVLTTRGGPNVAIKRYEDDDVDEEDESVEEMTVRIRGKQQEVREDEEEEAAHVPVATAAQDDAEEEEETEEEAATGGLKNRLADALRIRGPKKNERETVIEELEAASRRDEEFDYELPSLDLLLESEEFSYEEQEKEVRRKAKILEKAFASFGFQVKVVEIETGPVIAQFEVELESGLRLSKITSLADDLAIALRVPSVRVVAPIPGKNTVGIEVPNNERQIVRLREVMEEANGKAAKMRIPLYLGKDVSGKAMVVDLATLPHLLIAGRTGTGKSVCLNSIIMSMVMMRRPEDVRMLLIDPKMVELSSYMRLPHLMHPVVTDMKKAEAILAWAVDKMEERYALLARAGVRHISNYNQLGRDEIYERLRPETEEQKAEIPTHLPYIVIVADEMADLMMTAAKEVEAHIIRLAQKSRAVGIHLVLATQKPTVDVITGLIKSNLPARIAFQVASRTDSRVVLDEMGADKLLGNGDMLFLWPGTSTLLRGQGAYVGDDEINRVVDFVGTAEPQFVHELVHLPSKDAEQTEAGSGVRPHRDDMYEAAVDIIIREGRGSVSLLQRSLGIGYGRAARLVDFMAEDGIVGDYNGSQAREVLITLEQWAAMCGGDGAAAGASPGPARAATPPTKPIPKLLPSVPRSGDAPPRTSGGDSSGSMSASATTTTTKRRGRVVLAPSEEYDSEIDEEESLEAEEEIVEERETDEADETLVEPPFDVDEEEAESDELEEEEEEEEEGDEDEVEEDEEESDEETAADEDWDQEEPDEWYDEAEAENTEEGGGLDRANKRPPRPHFRRRA